MVLALNDQNFEQEVVKAEKPVLVDFWAPWCGPCQMAGPVIEELAQEYEKEIKVGKLNVDESPKMALEYGVMSIPTVIIFNQGKIAKTQVGFPGKEAYRKLIKEVI
jgi:thioredoxin 1